MHEIDCNQLEFLHKTLRNLLDDLEKKFGKQVITSLYRHRDTGVHGTIPVRGCDLRARNKTHANDVVLWANRYWEYDSKRPSRKVAIAHGDDDNFHIHLQTHPNTKEVK